MAKDLEEWTKCADWLERCGMLTEDQNNTLESVEHLASILKDGVILCNLLNRLKPNSIPYKSYSIRPQGSLFLYGKNIRAFLTHCKSAFKMKESQLFEISDLLDLQNFGKVIFTLSNLSKTTEAKKMNIEPFTAEEDTDYNITETDMDEVENEYNSSVYGGCTDDFDDNSDEIYDSLICSKPANIASFTSVLPKSVVERPLGVPKSRKEMCMEELLVTEKNFLDVLDSISINFMEKLRNRLNDEEFQTIFFKIEEIKKVHCNFYSKLQKAQNSSQPATEIAGCFLSCYMSMVLYGEFSSHMVSANQELERVCTQNPKVAAIVKRGAENANVKLHDLLTVPVQRILKYHLIIKELIKHCQESDVIELKKALAVMEDLNLFINEVKRDHENINTIYEIQKSIVDLDKFLDDKVISLDSYGRRHFDGEFEIKVSKAGPRFCSVSKGYVFVFDKLVILCSIKKKGEQYSYYASIAVRSLEIKLGSNERGLNNLVLSANDGKEERYIISCKKPENLVKLHSYLELAKDNCCPQTGNVEGHHFILTNFKEASTCSICKKLLRGKISQGYKCQKTSKIVHKECLSRVGTEMTERRRRSPPVPPRSKTVEHNTTHPRTPRTICSSDQFHRLPWFSNVNKPGASALLRDQPDGTFLVRFNAERGNYIISIKYQHVRHLVIYQEPKGEFFLGRQINFPDVQSLIEHYKKNSLQQVFSNIQSTLCQPYSEMITGPRRCRALYDFSPLDASHLGFCAGDIIEVLSTRDDPWLRGRLQNNKRGNFPKNYVEFLDD